MSFFDSTDFIECCRYFVPWLYPHVLCDITGIYKPIFMILGACESYESLLYNESKIITNVAGVFPGDDFEKYFWELFFVKFMIDKIPTTFGTATGQNTYNISTIK